MVYRVPIDAHIVNLSFFVSSNHYTRFPCPNFSVSSVIELIHVIDSYPNTVVRHFQLHTDPGTFCVLLNTHTESGHVFCEDCISQISSDRVANEPRCPTCRAEWGSRSPFRIYLNFADADKSSRLYDRLENISEDTPSIFVEKAGGIIKELVNDPGTALSDDQTVCTLVLSLQVHN